jgi:hypothetical protein
MFTWRSPRCDLWRRGDKHKNHVQRGGINNGFDLISEDNSSSILVSDPRL